jgi:ligand-binding sensor domain-containing protein/serine phosphatase RsbU (regulator of sigma subunit)
MYHFKIQLKYSLLLILILRSWVAVAQTTSINWFNTENGLIQNQVETMVQDNDGNLWLGTIAGLSKYNGFQFVSFTKNQQLAEDWIVSSCKTKTGDILFGHWAGNISRYNYKLKIFENLDVLKFTKQKTIFSIKQDQKEQFWITTEGAGIILLDKEFKFIQSISNTNGLPSNNVYDCDFDINGFPIFVTDSGLAYCHSLNKESIQKSIFSITKKDGLFSNRLISICKGINNELWIGSADEGLASYTSNSNSKSLNLKLNKIYNASNGLSSNFIKTIIRDSNNDIWIGTVGGGAMHLDVKSNQLTKYSTRQGLNYFSVNGIFEDREHSIWIATDLGVNQLQGEKFQLFDEADSIPNNIVWSIASNSPTKTWLGTNKGLALLTLTYGNKGHVATKQIKKITTVPELAISCLFIDSKNNLWAGTSFDGVYKINTANFKSEHISQTNGLSSNVVYSISEDKTGCIWIGTRNGASRYYSQTGKLKSFGSEEGLGGNHIYKIFTDSKQTIWFAALGGNLTSFDGKAFKSYDEKQGLKHRFILSITEDKTGNLWIGAYGGGLYKFDGKKFTNYNRENGLKTESPYSLVVDQLNNVWLGSNKGLEVLNQQTQQFKLYDKSNGFSGSECNPNAACIDSLGNLWFGTIMGALKFNPQQDYKNKVQPIVILNGIKVNAKDTTFPADQTFNHQGNNLTFLFEGVSLMSPDKLIYEYSLEGFDKAWVKVNYMVREAVYTNLPTGNYTFKIKACNQDGVWSKTISYAFRVKPPFWQTSVFIVLILAFVSFSVYGFDKFRNSRLLKSKLALEKRVEERTIELAQMNAELANKNKDVTDSMFYAKRIQENTFVAEQELQKHFPESFCWLQSKELVSGDFVWMKKNNDSVYIAVVDCTGHGIPAAFISMIANQLIEKVWMKHEGESPSLFLKHLSVLAAETFKTSDIGFQLQDGMDIGLCKINTDNKLIQFSGAQLNLICIQKNELKELIGDKITLGSLSSNEFTNHEISLSEGDQLYLYSDGFEDQFEGIPKKQRQDKFKQFLLSISSLEMNVQKKTINETFNELISFQSQLDDATIVGLKI